MLWLTPVDIKESGSSNSGSCDQASNFITLSIPGHSEESSKGPLLSSDKLLTTKVKVHFTYDELEFPKIIEIDHNSEFYIKVFSALSNKKSGSKPCHLKYRLSGMILPKTLTLKICVWTKTIQKYLLRLNLQQQILHCQVQNISYIAN